MVISFYLIQPSKHTFSDKCTPISFRFVNIRTYDECKGGVENLS